ncbi:hypothetical protein L3Q82_009636 [Scortum barcoo]|uniref:Uncharacterized protein n=1 Tax=Scortum barcoo TaxID=214431 RepID=A0ACB8WH25_9TELE|nr:hypothetical protein L3Q82_009636 [Scortum barcoo]
MDPHTLLYDVPPVAMERLCEMMDGGAGRFGWRALAVRIIPSLSEIRSLERVEAAGRSPTRELLWSWAQEMSRVQDLVKVLSDMGHHRALLLFQGPAQESPSPPRNQRGESAGQQSAAEVKVELFELQPEESSSSQSYPTCVNQRGVFIPTWLCVLEEKQPTSTFQDITFQDITFQDIIAGTKDFHSEMRISEGLFADIYRAQMGNKEFAVKLFKQVNQASKKKLWNIFRKEMEVHHLYQHPNILDLLCCFSDENRYCLVHPYLPNGSLYHRLHHRNGKTPLSWQERLAIIKGIAKAVQHLHAVQPCPVICGNISSSQSDTVSSLRSTNILLDDDLQPKLCNFGVAHLQPHSANPHCTITLNTSSHSNMGYLPEEYIRDGKLTFSLDVYSFGTVIMETVTGRKVKEDTPKQTLLRDLLVTEVEDSGGVDSCLRFLDVAAGQWPTAIALSLLGLALDCTASRHRSRPSMEDVLLSLSKLLPPPSCPPADQPHSLDDGLSIDKIQQSPLPSIPVEHDEQHSPPRSPVQPGPCECSQSEVTYLSDVVGAPEEAAVDLYSNWPVQCSCQAEASGLICEDCRSNGFTPNHSDSQSKCCEDARFHITEGELEKTRDSCSSNLHMVTFDHLNCTQMADFSVVENAAKKRLRNKLSLYNQGLIHTEELFSETGLQ